MLAILGKNDKIIYEQEFSKLKKSPQTVDYLIAYSSLDKIS